MIIFAIIINKNTSDQMIKQLNWHDNTRMQGLNLRCQFHQHFMCNFFIGKCFAQIFSHYSLALWFFGKRISAQKLLVKCWWNWQQGSISPTFWCKAQKPRHSLFWASGHYFAPFTNKTTCTQLFTSKHN
jgi:hypothetical protein